MPILFTYVRAAKRPKVANKRDLSGEDISLQGGDFTVTPAGDWATVSGDLAARQSLLREAAATPGSFVRRPDWGIGLESAVRKPRSRGLRDELTTRARRRFEANRRVSRVIKAEAIDFTNSTGGTGIALDVQVEVGRRDARIVTVLKPKV